MATLIPGNSYPSLCHQAENLLAQPYAAFAAHCEGVEHLLAREIHLGGQPRAVLQLLLDRMREHRAKALRPTLLATLPTQPPPSPNRPDTPLFPA